MEDHTVAAQQYFPTYKIDGSNKDIAIKEYETAARTLESEERLFAAAAGIAALFIGFFGWLAATNYEEVIKKFGNYTGKGPVVFMFIGTVLLFALLAIFYFSEMQKSLVHASRKVIVLRRMLGMSYGKIELVLPANRIEGANEPFSFPMFHGWTSYKCFPIYLVTLLSALFLLLISAQYGDRAAQIIAQSYGVSFLHYVKFGKSYWPYLLAAAWVVFLLSLYRSKLSDQHENLLQRIARLAATVLRVRLVGNFEEVLYRARLAVFEAERLKFPLLAFNPILVYLEDRTFTDHWGVSLRGILGALWRYIRHGKRSGGSTITQQLVRSLFIVSLRPVWRRKPIEIILAIWFERFFDKKEILNLYVCCVRYEHGVVGIAEALHYFFSELSPKDLEDAEIFFLVERIANTRSLLLPDKVGSNLLSLEGDGLLLRSDLDEVVTIFEQQINAGRVKLQKPGDLEKLKKKIYGATR